MEANVVLSTERVRRIFPVCLSSLQFGHPHPHLPCRKCDYLPPMDSEIPQTVYRTYVDGCPYIPFQSCPPYLYGDRIIKGLPPSVVRIALCLEFRDEHTKFGSLPGDCLMWLSNYDEYGDDTCLRARARGPKSWMLDLYLGDELACRGVGGQFRNDPQSVCHSSCCFLMQ